MPNTDWPGSTDSGTVVEPDSGGAKLHRSGDGEEGRGAWPGPQSEPAVKGPGEGSDGTRVGVVREGDTPMKGY
jgi:hypothetical protein